MASAVKDGCIACGAWGDACPVGAISLEDVAVIDAGTCIDCGTCAGTCPQGVIDQA